MLKNAKSKNNNANKAFADHLRKAVPEIRTALAKANEQFQSGGNSGRDGMISALAIAIQFLEAFGLKEDGLLTPLLTLKYGLHNLNKGNALPFLESTLAFRNLRLSDLRLAGQGVAAGAFHVLMQINKESATTAATIVSNELRRHDVTMEGKKNVTLRALQLWQTNAKKAPDSPRGKAYHWFVNADWNNTEKPTKAAVLEVLAHILKSQRIKDA